MDVHPCWLTHHYLSALLSALQRDSVSWNISSSLTSWSSCTFVILKRKDVENLPHEKQNEKRNPQEIWPAFFLSINRKKQTFLFYHGPAFHNSCEQKATSRKLSFSKHKCCSSLKSKDLKNSSDARVVAFSPIPVKLPGRCDQAGFLCPYAVFVSWDLN